MTTSPSGLNGTVKLPGDKSIAHRALMFSLLSPGTNTVKNLPQNQDVLSTLSCIQKLGVTSKLKEGNTLELTIPKELSNPSSDLSANNSGTSMRLLSGLLAGLNISGTLIGDEALHKRPMGRVINPLRLMDADISGKDNHTLAPIILKAKDTPLKPIEYTLPVASAQVKSSLILAGLFADGESVITEPTPTRDHTERMLTHLGIPIEIAGNTIRVSGPIKRDRPTTDWVVPGDVSSAAFLIVAGLLCPNSEITLPQVLLNPHRTGLIDALLSVGGDIQISNDSVIGGERIGDITVRSSVLKGNITLNKPDIPALIDEIPILAVAALYLDGTLTVRGAEELRTKESDRIDAVAIELKKLGIEITTYEDGLQVKGNPEQHIGQPTKALNAHSDHRIAMMLTVLNLIQNHRCNTHETWPLDGRDWANVSFPGFSKTLTELKKEAVHGA